MADTTAPLSAAEYSKRARALKDDPQAREGLTPVRLVLLSSFTTTLLEPFIRVEAARQGIYVDIHHGGFNQFEQELLADGWRSTDGTPEVLVVMMRLEDLHPDIGFRIFGDTPDDSFAAMSQNVLNRIETTLTLFRDRSKGAALVANFILPEPRIQPVFDANQPGSLTYKIQDLNRALVDRVSKRGGMHVWDYAGMVASAGTASWTDPRLWQLARNPIAAANQPVFARHLARTLRGAVKPAAKVLVLDLDNTIWGGVIGDDGVAGIHLGDEHPGRAFKEFQRACLGLKERGILLALASKNDEATVLEALKTHPEMLIKAKDCAAMRINWDPKSKNLKEMARELELGIDSFVFFDDNPVERAEVKESCPEVTVVDVPVDPAGYVKALADIAVFDIPAITAEDRLRAASYQAQIERRESEATAGSLDEFLKSLNMEVEIGRWNSVVSQRVTQLVGKTNQFNTTTRRSTEAELAELDKNGLGVFWLRMNDRYGDMGLIEVGVLTKEGDAGVVHGLVMSCRVANRAMELTMLAYMAKKAREAGCTKLIGEFIPTKKNTPVAQLFPKLGFTEIGKEGDVTRYAIDIGPGAPDALVIPEFVKVKEA